MYQTFRDEAVGDEIRAKEVQEVEQSLLKDLYVQYNVFDISPDLPIYRITAAAHVLEDVKNSTLTHTRINKTNWDDDEENPLLGRTFKTAEGEIGTLAITENMFGQCWSREPLSGSHWGTFRHGLPSVRLESTPRRLLAGVMDATNPYYVLQHAIGRMIYKARAEFDGFFSEPDFTVHLDSLGTRAMLSLWRLRTALSDEDEVRLLFYYNALNSWDRQFVQLQEPRAAVRFSWEGAISAVEGEPGLSPTVLSQVRTALGVI